MARKHYYYVRTEGQIRLAHAETPREALRETFGTFPGPGYFYKDIGTRSPRYMSATLLRELQADVDWIEYRGVKGWSG